MTIGTFNELYDDIEVKTISSQLIPHVDRIEELHASGIPLNVIAKRIKMKPKVFYAAFSRAKKNLSNISRSDKDRTLIKKTSKIDVVHDSSQQNISDKRQSESVHDNMLSLDELESLIPHSKYKDTFNMKLNT